MIMGADPTTRGLLVVNFFQLFVGGGLKAPPPSLKILKDFWVQEILSIFNEWVICPFIDDLQKRMEHIP
jgi:hypothetical protein